MTSGSHGANNPELILDDMDLTKYAWEFSMTSECDLMGFSGDYSATLGPLKVSDDPFDLIYSDWYHDFGFHRRVRFTGASDDGLTYGLDYVETAQT